MSDKEVNALLHRNEVDDVVGAFYNPQFRNLTQRRILMRKRDRNS